MPAGNASEVCLVSNGAAAFVNDVTVPASGMTGYYLVRGENSCGAGTFGFTSASLERLPTICP